MAVTGCFRRAPCTSNSERRMMMKWQFLTRPTQARRDAPHPTIVLASSLPATYKTVRLGGSVARALREPILIILQGFTWFSAG